MEKITSLNPETDLHVSTHLNEAELPALIRPILSMAQSPSEKDMLLMALLTASGSCMPNLYFRYGLTGKRYYPNLQCFIVGSAACGKGIANLALEFVRKVHEATPLVIAGDSSYPGFYRQLERQNGRGYIHESEGSVITDVWRSSVTNYNTALRKAAEHEPITRNRANDSSCIACPQLSVLLTGTFSQYRALVPSIENGYFSRLLTLVVQDQQAFSSKYVEPANGANTVMATAAEQLFDLCQTLYKSRPIEFCLTPEQRTRLGHHMETAYPTLIRMLGEDFHSVVLRMAVQIERIATILTALRMNEEKSQISNDQLQIICSNQDYALAELIGNKLLLHMAQAYQLIKGTQKVSIPSVNPLDQKQILFSLLPEKFESKTLVAEAQSQGISRRTAIRWNDTWQEQGLVQQIRYGTYKKMA